MILCITHSQDYFNIDIFFEYLKSKNIPFFRLNSDCLNHQSALSLQEDLFILENEYGHRIHSKEIKAVWHRKSWQFTVPEDLDKNFIQVFKNEYESLRSNFFTIIENLPWMNPLSAEKKIETNKMLQLKLAKKSGLLTPKTVFTNSQNTVKEFFNLYCNGKAVAKLHDAVSKSMSGNDMISTIFLEENDLEKLSDLMYCPMIFQPYIEKKYELRIVYINGEFFTGKINSSSHIDWRVSQVEFYWEKYELPSLIKSKIYNMMSEMGLVFGAIDMIKSTDENYYFLEVNPQGEWGMLQKELGFPIAQKIADYLIKKIHTNEQ